MTVEPPPPQNIDAEESVLGALLLAGADGAAAVVTERVRAVGLERTCFYRDSHATIYATVVELVDSGVSPDALLVADALDAARVLEVVGGVDKIRDLAAGAVATANVAHHARLVVEAARRRDELAAAKAWQAASVNGGLAANAELRERVRALLERKPAGAAAAEAFSVSVEEFVAVERPVAEALIVDADGRPLIARNSLTLAGGLGGSGKTTFFIELALHLAAGVDYLCFAIPEPVSVLLIENEGPEEMFAQKIEAKLRSFPHPLRARIGVCTADWGGFTLADARLHERLRADIADHGYQLVFGDPLDSLGIEGVGSPDDTRKFLELMKAAGLFTSVAWWLNTHPRKEETKEALNEISGAWGGKPDAVLLLRMLDDDRSQVRFAKIRWAKRGRRPAILLAFDADTETFTYLGEEGDDERDYRAEIEALLGDGAWRTVKEISAKTDADRPGIGAGEKIVKGVLGTHPDVFEERTGEDAKAVGRSPTATVWQVRSGDNAPNAPAEFSGEGEGGATCTAHIDAVQGCTSPHPSAEVRRTPMHLGADEDRS